MYRYSDTLVLSKLPRVDVIVVLAGARGRITGAVDLWMRYRDAENFGQVESKPILYVAGTGRSFNWKEFLEHVRSGERAVIKNQDVYLEAESTNTVGNAKNFFAIAREKRWRKFILMTSPYHMRRAQILFERYNTDNLDFWTFTVTQDPYHENEWMSTLSGVRLTWLEYLKLLKELP